MLDIGKDAGPAPKCFFSHVSLPQTIDDSQPPTKRKPFASLLDCPFNHTIDILFGSDDEANFTSNLHAVLDQQRYARVHLKLKDVIEGDFFNQYIKTGNILLLSQDTCGVGNTYSLHDGILRLELDKPTYERAGLQGTVIPTPGRKHTKARYAIELNLRLPSMVRGRALFNRIVYAFTHVLTETRTWLFHDALNPGLDPTLRSVRQQDASNREVEKAAASSGAPTEATSVDDPEPRSTSIANPAVTPDEPSTSPITKHHPLLFPIEPEVTRMPATTVPAFPDRLSVDHAQIEAAELLEWLSLAMMGSPRVRAGERSDVALSRYGVPELTSQISRRRDDGGSGRGSGEGRGPAERGEEEEEKEDAMGEEDAMQEDGSAAPAAPPAQSQAVPVVQHLTRVRYRGFIPGPLVSRALIATVRSVDRSGSWAALRAQGFGDGKKRVMVLVRRDMEAMVWEY